MIEGLLVSWGATAAWSAFGPVLENLAQDIAKDAAKSYVGKCFGSVLSPLNRKPLTKAIGSAIKELLKLLEDELLDAELETYELEVGYTRLQLFVHILRPEAGMTARFYLGL